MSKTIYDLKIERPCPMYLTDAKKSGDFHYCKTCTKQVRDFRGMSFEQIMAEIKPGQCGTFDSEQLPGQPTLSFRRRLLFYSLMLISFLGFQVHPISAQAYQDTSLLNDTSLKSNAKIDKKKSCNDCKEVKEKSKKHRSLFRFRRRYRKLRGCFNF